MSTLDQILLPGPSIGAYTVTLTSQTQDWSGEDISISRQFQGDGRGMVQVLEFVEAHSSEWHPFVGCELSIDFGKGPVRRVLSEAFGAYGLE